MPDPRPHIPPGFQGPVEILALALLVLAVTGAVVAWLARRFRWSDERWFMGGVGAAALFGVGAAAVWWLAHM